jgi:transmembrane sensor
MCNKERLQYLLERYIKAMTSPEEESELADLVKKADNETISGILKQAWDSPLQIYPVFTDEEAQSYLRKILSEEKNANRKITYFTYRWLKIAAIITVILLLGALSSNLFLKKGRWENLTAGKNISPVNDLPPGGNKAVLTLGNGNQIILDTASTGMISRQSGAQIVKSGDGQVEYQSDNSIAEKIDYNTISTPQGGQYQLTLSDGSKVWLNAASSIRFPAVFKGKERKVFITGEAYFEVNPQSISNSAKKGKQKNIPFIVDIAGKGTVEVLGTHFNINAYTDEEAIKTTLLEGSVGFRPITSQNMGKTPEPVIIAPGQQVILSPAGQVQVDRNVNLEKVVAWKNGYFLFSSQQLPEIMNQIARWYDVDVVFKGKTSNEKFSGKIQRDLNLSEALKILEKYNIRFNLEGRTLYIKS